MFKKYFLVFLFLCTILISSCTKKEIETKEVEYKYVPDYSQKTLEINKHYSIYESDEYFIDLGQLYKVKVNGKDYKVVDKKSKYVIEKYKPHQFDPSFALKELYKYNLFYSGYDFLIIDRKEFSNSTENCYGFIVYKDSLCFIANNDNVPWFDYTFTDKTFIHELGHISAYIKCYETKHSSEWETKIKEICKCLFKEDWEKYANDIIKNNGQYFK